jgi:hypothetical protein
MLSGHARSTVQLAFRGSSLALYRILGPAGGQASISIDGKAYGTLAFYYPGLRYHVPAIFDGLRGGSHTLLLQIEAVTPPRSHGRQIALTGYAAPDGLAQSSAQSVALAAINRYRMLIHIPAAQASGALMLAAQDHAGYLAHHNILTHSENVAMPDSTGQSPSDRSMYFGFPVGSGEDALAEGLDTNITDATAAAQGVDDLLTTVYHRRLALCFTCQSLGFGLAHNAQSRFLVLDQAQGAASVPPGRRIVYTYPANGERDVPPAWSGDETPNPLPGKHGPFGYPLSLSIAQPPGYHPASRNGHLVLFQVSLRDSAGHEVPTYSLTETTDPAHLLGPDEVFLIPRAPLAYGTTYQVFLGGFDSAGKRFGQRWSFTTQKAARVTALEAQPAPCSATVAWTTGGPSRGTVTYGTGRAPAHTLAEGQYSGPGHALVLDPLAPRRTYYFRIQSRDATGYTWVTSYQTFTTPAPRTLQVPGQYPTIAAALAQARACDIVRVAPGRYRGNLILPYGVRLVGAGATQTIIQGTGHGSVILASDGSIVAGVTVTGSGTGYWDSGVLALDNASPTIRDAWLSGNSMGAVAYCFQSSCSGHMVVRNAVIAGNRVGGIVVSHEAPRILNDTIASDVQGVAGVFSAGTVIENNILVKNTMIAVGITLPATGVRVAYNDVYANHTAYAGVPPGPGARSVDPRFVEGRNGNYALQAGSPCLKGGDPAWNVYSPTSHAGQLGAYGNLLPPL